MLGLYELVCSQVIKVIEDLLINEWFRERGTLKGIDSAKSINLYVQLDGSHRRSVAYLMDLKKFNPM